jgi:hypothetical protein
METWIPGGDEIRTWCELLADIVEYRFDDLDWDAVFNGMSNADQHKGRWFEYSIVGTDTIGIRMAYNVWENNVTVLWEAPAHLHEAIKFAASVMQKFKLVRR